MKINPATLSKSEIETIVDILNRGNQCEVKRERETVVIVEIKRSAIVKKPIV